MKRMASLAILAVAPLLAGALWMDKQPSYKSYEAPVLAPPAGSVPVAERESASRSGEFSNPVAAAGASVARGKTLFDTYCAFCHGRSSAERGPVGKRLTPPPPGLDRDKVQRLSDSAIYKAITFGFGRMPPFRDKLLPTERWHLVNYLRTRQ